MQKQLALFFSFRISLKEWYELGLIEREVKIYNKLSNDFEKIYFFTYGGSKDKEYNSYLAKNIYVVPIPFLKDGGRKKSRFLLLIYSFLLPFIHWKILKHIDVIKTNQISGSWPAVLAKYLFGSKMVLRLGYLWSFFSKKNKESFIKYSLKRTIEKLAAFFSDSIILASRSYISYFKGNEKKINIVPNYVDTDIFKPMPIEKKENSVCFVGRLEKEKNIFSLLDAIKGIKCELTIIGQGGLQSEINKKAQENNVALNYIKSVPNSKLPEILNKHEIFVLPSFYEGNPKVLLEAMSCQIAVIGTNVKGTQLIIENEKDGLLCATDAESIRQAITKLLADSQLRDRIAKNARQKIINYNSFDEIYNKEKEILTTN